MAVREIDVDALADLIGSEGLLLVDVREDDEYADARVAGTLHIPLGEIPARHGEIPDGTVHIICAAGGRSMQACEFLSTLGRETVNIAGGTNGWIASGRPTESGSPSA